MKTSQETVNKNFEEIEKNIKDVEDYKKNLKNLKKEFTGFQQIFLKNLGGLKGISMQGGKSLFEKFSKDDTIIMLYDNMIKVANTLIQTTVDFSSSYLTHKNNIAKKF